MQAELKVDCRNKLGEGPLWHTTEQALYWTDIDGHKLYRLAYGESVPTVIETGQTIGGFTIQSDGSLLLFGAGGQILSLAEEKMSVLVDSLPGEEGLRFNDVAADPAGRVFCGIYGNRPGRLYRLDTDGSIRVVLDGIGCSNGIGWSPDRSVMYYTDSSARSIWAFDYDISTGDMANQRPFVVRSQNEGVPDGMTVDAEGFVWSAIWGDACVIRYSPSGEEVQRVATGSKCTTCPTFGGPELDELFITSASYGDNDPETAGALYWYRPAVGGIAEFRSQIAFGA